ncbi:hypothetical protein BAUCODRAFT_125888 [Baudoinia panamericana UAMH 10762]|uniref:Uncharacterized protein n=1 Tax=Baudoinia panamericana (strain UAMH 10762) TaxID=717646 RepID=M2MNB7_BAUPA|nr:uncharacterized protein BAUCODRAFT_125888 [Baudoinia panamericana UAMH 10762]EMC92938.1 hypothetical protein BAUCODRAFT_125888 [Baudoinia panamericana UAMH 10762]
MSSDNKSQPLLYMAGNRDNNAPEVAYEAPILSERNPESMQSVYPTDHKPAPYYSDQPVQPPQPTVQHEQQTGRP